MTEPLSKEQLAAICARADAATPGPWKWHEGDLLTEDNFSRQHSHSSMFSSVLHLTDDAQGVNDLVSWEYVRSVEDAEFIANARADIPALLAHIDALEAERDALQQAVNEAWDITSEPISSEVEMHPRITQIMDALQDALSKPTLDKYNVKLD